MSEMGGKKRQQHQLLFSILLLFYEGLTDSGGRPVCGKLPPANKLNAGPCWLREQTIVWIVVC